jgi:hypothetical protein
LRWRRGAVAGRCGNLSYSSDGCRRCGWHSGAASPSPTRSFWTARSHSTGCIVCPGRTQWFRPPCP